MGPLAGVVLGLVALLSSSGRMAWTEPSVEPPTSSGSSCLPIRRQCTITINRNGQLYFSTDNADLQAAIVEQVARAHGIQLNAQQQQQLQQMPYVGLDIRQLPTFLTLLSWQKRATLLKDGIPHISYNQQLTEYIDAANNLTSGSYPVPALWVIRADRRVSYSQFRQVADLLKQRDIYRIFLGTRMGMLTN